MWQILIRGGWIMLPLSVCSLIAATIIIERFFFFRGLRAKEALKSTEEVIDLVSKGLLERALHIADKTNNALKNPLPVLKVLSAGIKHHLEAEGAMEAAAITEISAMKRGFVALDTIVTLSPLLGLLGTIIGMIKSFNIMSSAGLGQPHAVTGGVAEALIATATGIAIAVVTLIPYNYFVLRVEQETDVIEALSTRLEVALNARARE